MSGLSSAARDKIGAGAAHKKGRPKPPPLNFSSPVVLVSAFANQQLACEAIILPILQCPLLAEADISTRPLR
jgi:hypothetical protein